MRSRPAVKVYYSSSFIEPGKSLLVDVRFQSRSKTPVDFVDFVLKGGETVVHGQGQYRRVVASERMQLSHREKGTVFTPGEHRYRVRFDVPPDLPPTYRGVGVFVAYGLQVHVAIPWWPDVRATYDVPIVVPQAALPGSLPKTYCTSDRGPSDGKLYLEASVDKFAIAPGDAIEGAVSVANVAAAKVRGVYFDFVLRENALGWSMPNIAKRLRVRLVDGAPPEGQTIPFKVRLPADVTPSFAESTFGLSWSMEIGADVVWNEDLVLRIPLQVVRGPPTGKPSSKRVPPVGRERRALVWREVAQRAGLECDLENETMKGRAGQVNMEIGLEQRESGMVTVARYGWPELGLELRIAASTILEYVGFGNALVVDHEGKHRARARERAQLHSFLTPEVSAALDWFEEVQADDHGARVVQKGGAHSVQQLDGFVARSQVLLASFARSYEQIDAPSLFTGDVPAWRAFAQRHQGRFEPGRIYVHDARMGIDRFSIGIGWLAADQVAGTEVRIPIDPPLVAPPADDDPSLSPMARDLLREVKQRIPTIELGAKEFKWLDPESISDPARLESPIELVLRLARSMRGLERQGPFR